MGMLDTSTGLLKALPEKPALSRVGSEGDNLGNGSRKQRNLAEGYGYGGYGGGSSGFGIGAPRGDGVVPEDGDGLGIRSGLASPTTSVSSSSGSAAGYDTYMAPVSRHAILGSDERY